jgi:hypothetical protein
MGCSARFGDALWAIAPNQLPESWSEQQFLTLWWTQYFFKYFFLKILEQVQLCMKISHKKILLYYFKQQPRHWG